MESPARNHARAAKTLSRADASDLLLAHIGTLPGVKNLRLTYGEDDRPRPRDADEETARLPVGRVGNDEATLYLRHDGEGLPPEARTAAEALLPALLATLRAGARLEATERRAARAEAALGTTRMGVVIVDAAGTIGFANPAAEAMLNGGHGLYRNANQLRAVTLHDNVLLRAALSGAIAAPADFATEAEAGAARLFVSILAGSLEPAGRSHVVWLLDPQNSIAADLSAFIVRHALSPAESALASNLALGMTVEDCAATVDIKISTARSHLKSIFFKCGATSQADLARIMLSTDLRTSLQVHTDDPDTDHL